MKALQEIIISTDLGLLGFDEQDAQDLHAMVRSTPDEDPRWARVTAIVERVDDLLEDPFADPGFPDVQGSQRVEVCLDWMLALVAIASRAHDAYVRRGVPPSVAWRSLSDLGQQARVHRLAYGRLGLVTADWPAENFLGRHLWLGRLQFTMERADDGYEVGIHIPEAGPLTPEAVDASLSEAAYWIPKVFPEYPVRRWHMHSWLLDPRIVGRLHPESNLARFAGRFELVGEPEEDEWSDLFFVFRRDRRIDPVDLSALPAMNSLERAVRAVLQEGPGVGWDGTLLVTPEAVAGNTA